MEHRSTINDPPSTTVSPWPHRLAWIVACGVFPLIWMGGLVTTYGAGMAVLDWPTTRGSWFYPLQKWIWDITSELFLEHGHRTIAQLVGLFAIIMLIAVFRCDRRKSVKWLAVVILCGLIFQGVLGGFRVLWEEKQLARIHGCTAPVVFCLCAIMVTVTSKAWRNLEPFETSVAARRLFWLMPTLVILIYSEVVFGTQVRHPLINDMTSWSLFWVWIKVITAGLVGLGMLYLLSLAPKLKKNPNSLLRRRIFLLASLFLLQIVLACFTWVANYGWPKWFTDYLANWDYTVVKHGDLQVWMTTAHSAVGSLVLLAAVNLTVWSRRLSRGPRA
jgi:cytochrome c oxidase assembly protein subunit 15